MEDKWDQLPIRYFIHFLFLMVILKRQEQKVEEEWADAWNVRMNARHFTFAKCCCSVQASQERATTHHFSTGEVILCQEFDP